ADSLAARFMDLAEADACPGLRGRIKIDRHRDQRKAELSTPEWSCSHVASFAVSPGAVFARSMPNLAERPFRRANGNVVNFAGRQSNLQRRRGRRAKPPGH